MQNLLVFDYLILTTAAELIRAAVFTFTGFTRFTFTEWIFATLA